MGEREVGEKCGGVREKVGVKRGLYFILFFQN